MIAQDPGVVFEMTVLAYSWRKEESQLSDTDIFSILVVMSTGWQVLSRILYRL